MTADEIFACAWIAILIAGALFGTLADRASSGRNHPRSWMPPKNKSYGERLADARRSNVHQ